jgi:hypothetical protein
MGVIYPSKPIQLNCMVTAETEDRRQISISRAYWEQYTREAWAGTTSGPPEPDPCVIRSRDLTRWRGPGGVAHPASRHGGCSNSSPQSGSWTDGGPAGLVSVIAVEMGKW